MIIILKSKVFLNEEVKVYTNRNSKIEDFVYDVVGFKFKQNLEINRKKKRVIIHLIWNDVNSSWLMFGACVKCIASKI